MDDRRKQNKGRPPKPLTKEQILMAMARTKSNKAAARCLNVSYHHYRDWSKKYTGEDGRTLFEIHKNQSGKGIPKFLLKYKDKDDINILDVIEGRVSATHFSPDKLKRRMVAEGYLKEECAICGFHERRLTDFKIPLILHFKDNDTTHYGLDNVRFLCYNCYFLNIGEVFNKNDMNQLETHVPTYKTSENVDMQLDEYQLEQLRQLGLYDPPKPENDGSDLISKG